jgi:hypothetical protein
MFTSKEHLHENLGVDKTIAKFFVDRSVPINNRYWKGRYLYVAGGTGYLFIPLFFDLQYKCGADIKVVLSEAYVQLTEQILHSAARYEFEEISFSEHISNCESIMAGCIRNQDLYNDLLTYFKSHQLKPYKNLGTASKPLNRGDTLLFSLCFLDVPSEVTYKIIESWYALVPSFLLMDDVSDLQNDREKQEENSISDFGEGTRGIENALDFLRGKFNQLKQFNPKLGSFFENGLDRKIQTPYMQSLLNPDEYGAR